MIKSKLVASNDPILHKIAEEVQEGEDVSGIIKTMIKVLQRHRGAGLAAPQIGVSKRIIVMSSDTPGYEQEIINPVITKRYGGRMNMTERCLSFPGVPVKKQRYKRIVVEGLDKRGNKIKRQAKGFAACVVQHEVDHLNGVTIA